ncbi:MAG: hypothetical protein WC044_11835 [Crocinitomicaceae bacterium]
MTEQKLFYTVFATLLVYGLGSFFQLGTFVLPLPFFELGLLLISFFLGFSNGSKNKTLSLFLIAFGILQFFAINYNYSFFLNDQNLEILAQSPITDLFSIAARITLLGILFLQNRTKIVFTHPIHLLLFSLVLLSTLFIPEPAFILLPLLYLCILLVIKGKQFDHSWSLWLYLLLFIGSRELSFTFL